MTRGSGRKGMLSKGMVASESQACVESDGVLPSRGGKDGWWEKLARPATVNAGQEVGFTWRPAAP